MNSRVAYAATLSTDRIRSRRCTYMAEGSQTPVRSPAAVLSVRWNRTMRSASTTWTGPRIKSRSTSEYAARFAPMPSPSAATTKSAKSGCRARERIA
jgi:hypothetical protein